MMDRVTRVLYSESIQIGRFALGLNLDEEEQREAGGSPRRLEAKCRLLQHKRAGW